MGWNPIKDAERAARKMVDKVVKPAGETIKREVNKIGDGVKSGVRKAGAELESGMKRVGHDIESGLKRVGNEVEDGVKAVGHEVEDGVRNAGKEIEDTFEERIPELVEDAMEAIAKAAAEGAIAKGLDAAAAAVETFSPSSITVIVGVELAFVIQGEITVQATMPNPTAKLTEIRHYAKNPPSGRAQIMLCLKEFGPSSIQAEFKVSGNGFAVDWDGDEKYDRVDAFLAKHGID